MNNPVTELSSPIESRSNGSSILFGARPISGEHVTVTGDNGATVSGVYIRREDRAHHQQESVAAAFRHAPDNTCDIIVPFAFYVSQP
jgi:hypothetical protein